MRGGRRSGVRGRARRCLIDQSGCKLELAMNEQSAVARNTDCTLCATLVAAPSWRDERIRNMSDESVCGAKYFGVKTRQYASLGQNRPETCAAAVTKP